MDASTSTNHRDMPWKQIITKAKDLVLRDDDLKKGLVMTGHFLLLICVKFNVMINENTQIIPGMSFVNKKYPVFHASLLKRAIYKKPSSTIRLCIFRNYNKNNHYLMETTYSAKKKGHKAN